MKMVDTVVFPAAKIEKVLEDWYRENYLIAGSPDDVEVEGLMSKVKFNVREREPKHGKKTN